MSVRSHAWRRDLAIALVIALVAGVASGASVRAFWSAGGQSAFYQSEFGPAVLFACGRGYANPADPIAWARVHQFLHAPVATLDCSELPSDAPTTPLNIFQAQHRYLMTMVGLTWRIFGISWLAVAWVIGAFAGVSAALSYAFCRLGMGAGLAAVVTTLWMSSPLHLSQMPHLRDYGKTPFFLFTVCVLGYVARYRYGVRTTLVAMAVAGAVLGFGFGMRMEVSLYVPFVVAAVLAFRPRPTLEDVALRVGAAALGVATFCIVASPILKSYQTANNIAHVAILGLSDPSRDWLGLNRAPYSFGYLYHDSYLATVVSAYSDRTAPDPHPLQIGTKPYELASNEYYDRLVRTFPADMLTRAWAAVTQVLRLPFRQDNSTPPVWFPASARPLYQARARMLGWMAEIPPLAAAALLVIAISAWSVRVAALVFLLGAALAGMPALQFQARHVSPLEILPFWVYGCLLGGAWRLVASIRGAERSAIVSVARGRWHRAAIFSVCAAAIVAGPVVAARRYQGATVAELLTSYEHAGLEPLTTVATVATDPTRVLLETPLPVNRDPRASMTSDMLVVDVAGAACDHDVVDITLRYRGVAPFGDISTSGAFLVPAAGRPSLRIFFPALTLGPAYEGTRGLEFVGVEVPVGQRPCLSSLARFRAPEKFPLLLESILPSDWREAALHETIRDVEPPDPRFEWKHLERYGLPENYTPGRRQLAHLERLTVAPEQRSAVVRRVTPELIEVRGKPQSRSEYLLAWPHSHRARGSAFFVEGEVVDGGLTLGIAQNEKWVSQLNVYKRGGFRAAIQLNADGMYGPVLANLLAEGSTTNRVTITRYGWLPPPE